MCFLRNRFAAFFITGVLLACTAPKPPADLTTLVATAAQKDSTWRQGEMVAGPFRLAVALKAGKADAPLSIYIEGDGRAFAPNGGISFNPTPANPVALNLALADTGNVLYMARPCQFVDIKLQPVCANRKVFTDLRWSEVVVQAYVDALQPYIERYPRVRLVGYSGGAYVALAVAGRLPESALDEVLTVAGNLSPNTIHKLHGVPLLEDVVPLYYGKLAGISQTHYIGANDRVIKPEVKDAYLAAAGTAGQGAVAAGRWRWVQVEADHGEGWQAVKP